MKKWFCLVLVVLMTVGLAGTAFGEGNNIRVGCGLGIPYGVIGGNLEIGLSDNIALSGGIGIAPGGLAYCVGGRLYFAGPDEMFRPRVGAYYGTVGVLEDWYDYHNINGIALGAGIDWRVENMDVDFDLMLPYIEGYGFSVKISFGAGFYF